MTRARSRMLHETGMPGGFGACAADDVTSGPRLRIVHRTRYEYERPVRLSAHLIRLRPAGHTRTPIDAYRLHVTPEQHDLKWHFDHYGNCVARLLFAQPTPLLDIGVEMVATLNEVNPFDFYVADHAWQFPFAYTDEEHRALAPCLAVEPPGPLLAQWLARMRGQLLSGPMDTVEFLVAVNRWIADEITYEVRTEPGVQDCEQTLRRGNGACRDSSALLMHVLRHCGIAARFVSGYLVQLGAAGQNGGDDVALHAWVEAYLPGAGWIGLDPTSGLLATEGHIPLACAGVPECAAPVSGCTEIARSSMAVSMQITRLPPVDCVAA